jgi:transposase
VLLNSRKYSVADIADIYEVDRDTVSHWLDHWEDDGATGLYDQEGRGRKPILNEKEQKQALKIVEKDPRSSKRSLRKIEEKIKKKISHKTLKRLLRNGNNPWKRLRRRVPGKRDEPDFQAAKPNDKAFVRRPVPASLIFTFLTAPASRLPLVRPTPGKRSARPSKFQQLRVIAATFWLFSARIIAVIPSFLKRQLTEKSLLPVLTI